MTKIRPEYDRRYRRMGPNRSLFEELVQPPAMVERKEVA
jgi:hypothetical protein